MSRHVLACVGRSFECSNGHISGGMILAILGVMAVLSFVTERARKWWRQGGPPPPPREPRHDLPPSVASLLSGNDYDAYTAPVSAVTPAGITVRHARCCAAGHVTPLKAVQHALAIADRIERSGR